MPNSEVQAVGNGPWTPEFRKRVAAVKDKLGLSLQDLGDAFGFSGSFVHGLLAGKPTHNMASKHADGVLRALEGFEVQAGIRKISGVASNAGDLASALKIINDHGFSAELKPLKS